MKHYSWPDIESFHHIRKFAQKCPELLGTSANVTYRAKVKLHGTNAGVVVCADGTCYAMSRTQVITPENDNMGFAAWVAARKDAFKKLAPDSGCVVIYGEWCGPGIMKGVATCSIPNRIFAVFAMRIINENGETPHFVVGPTPLQQTVSQLSFEGCHVIPWFNEGETFEVDWQSDPAALEGVLNRINEAVAGIEKEDPWVKATFDVSGVGEGLVTYPVDFEHVGYEMFSNLCFKAKGEQHRVVAKSKPAQVDPTVAKNLASFAELVVTPARLEQGARAVTGGELVFEGKNIGPFLAWVNKDLAKEVTLELEASGLDEKQAFKACSDLARGWYMQNLKKF